VTGDAGGVSGSVPSGELAAENAALRALVAEQAAVIEALRVVWWALNGQ